MGSSFQRSLFYIQVKIFLEHCHLCCCRQCFPCECVPSLWVQVSKQNSSRPVQSLSKLFAHPSIQHTLGQCLLCASTGLDVSNVWWGETWENRNLSWLDWTLPSSSLWIRRENHLCGKICAQTTISQARNCYERYRWTPSRVIGGDLRSGKWYDLNFEISVTFLIVELEGSMWFQGQKAPQVGKI